MKPPLLLTRPRAAIFLLAILVPAVFGLITGILLGISGPAYTALTLLGVLGGLAAGYEMPNASEGAERGLCGGLLFSTFILLGHAIEGSAPETNIPSHAALIIVFTIFSIVFGMIGGALRARSDRREGVAETTA